MFFVKAHKAFIVLTLLSLLPFMLEAQEAAVPNWVHKVQKAIVSVVTYDKDNNLLRSGTGFYISTDGIAIADYSLFNGAYSAFVEDMSGQKSKVERILGVDDTYSLVKFKVAVKKSATITRATSHVSEGAIVFALKFSKDKISICPTASVSTVEVINDTCSFYTLSYPIDNSYMGAPLFNANGELVATVQPSMGLNGYALGDRFIDGLKIQAIASKVNSLALENIHIYKGLPKTSEESLIYLYIKSKSMGDEEYLDILNLFVATYPDNSEGYYRRATPLVDLGRFDEAEKDLQTYYKLSTDKALANSNIANIIYTKLLYQPSPKYDGWNYDIAISYINKSIDATPDNVDYQLLKSQILMSMKDYSGALTIYDKLNSGNTRSPSILYAACLAHEGLGDTATIQIELLDSALAMFKTPLPAEAANYVLHRGQLYANIGRYRDAINDYNQYCYLSNNKVNATFYYDRSQLELSGKMYQQALDDLNTAIGISPNTTLYYVEKCALLLRVNEINDCISTAKQALQLEPNNIDAYRMMGYAQIQKGDVTSGKQNLLKAVELGDSAAKEILEKYVK